MNADKRQPGIVSGTKPTHAVVSLIVHQYIGTLGIDILAGFLVAYGFDVFQLFGKHFPPRIISWILTGTPYYPVQIGLGLVLGWSIGRRLQHRAMLWTGFSR